MKWDELLRTAVCAGSALRPVISHEHVAHLIPPLLGLFFGRDGGRGGTGTDDRKKSIFDGVIGPKSAKGDAAPLAIVHPPTGAAVTRDVMLGA
jgi:hypothetical protein